MAFSDFDQYFSSVYQERWSNLFAALKTDSSKVMRLSFPELHQLSVPNHLAKIAELEHCYSFGAKGEYFFSDQQLKLFYVMDPASMIAANCLTITPGMHVLDMCSAPGGKGLILAEKLKGNGEIILNEFSRDRRDRLTQVVRDYIPMDYRAILFVKGKDGALYGLSHPQSFDAILVDAPCSGEQHLVQSPGELDKWTLKRSKRLSTQQYSMLCSALLAAKDGAEIVYSTCSISPLENDEVIKKLIDKKGDGFELIDMDLSRYGAEKTLYGNIFLPDRCQYGPIFVAKLKVKK